MLFRKTKRTGLSITSVVVGLVFSMALFASNAFAECGPGFTNKQQLIQYYQHNPAAASGLRKELLAHAKSDGFQADETVVNWLRSPEQRVKVAPSGYRLKSNTYCPAGPGQYQPYSGLLNNMPGKGLLWHCTKSGKCVPVLKGYCMNFVTGPPVHKKHPKKPKPKKCKKGKVGKPPHCRKPKKAAKVQVNECHAGQIISSNGNCVNQENTSSETCGNGQVKSETGCVTIQINNNCGNVDVGGSEVLQGGNCNTVVEEKSPPCGCEKPEEPKKEPPTPSITITSLPSLNMIPAGKNSGELHITVNASEAGGSLTIDPGIGGVSNCESSIPQGSLTFSSLGSGNTTECYILYAPEDKDKPTAMTVTYTATLSGATPCVKEDTFEIEYPTRP